MSWYLLILQLLTMLTNKILAKKWINQQHTSSSSSFMGKVNGKGINNHSHNKNIMMNSFMKNKVFQSIPILVNQPSGSVVKVVTDIDDTVWSSGGVR